MTINIALATSEGLVLGCDSIASSIEYVVNPFEMEQPNDELGEPLKNEDGRPLVALDYSSIRPVVTNAWGGVTKLFQIHGGAAPVAAVTSGIAQLKDRTMKSYAEEFLVNSMQFGVTLGSVQEISEAFLNFMREQYLEHYEGSPIPEEYWTGPVFLTGGYGNNDELPSVYRLDVKSNQVYGQFEGGEFGVAWSGQADSVERLIRGYDSAVREEIEKHLGQLIDDNYEQMTSAMAGILENVFAQLGVELPNDVDTVLPSKLEATLPWDKVKVGFDYGNLPLQSAVDFVAFLVNLQSGKSRFAHGVATVGGRTQVSVVSKVEGFRILNEPELQHRHTGFGDDV